MVILRSALRHFMSPEDAPVQTQTKMALAALNRVLSSECHDNVQSEGKPVGVGRRRVFVQTEKGCVLGIELDGGDNAHTVKRRLQVVFNVPIEQSWLTFGDIVLKNDLSVIRNNSPLLLTRNMLYRSSSTPCLSLTGKDTQLKNATDPINILGCSTHCNEIKHIVKEVVKGIQDGVDPMPVHSGMGGAYFFKNSKGVNVAVVKPTDEEPFAPNNPNGLVGKVLGQPGVKRTVRVGETGFREVAAYLLDYDHFADVPPTILVKITHSVFNVNDSVSRNKAKNQRLVSKIASFQQFIPHDFVAIDYGTSSFPVADVHRIGIFDIRIFNTDRHAGNLLVRKIEGGAGRFSGQMALVPIDHGLCLPESLDDPYFEWIHWPQASIPFSDDELEYIAKLDPVRDSDMLRRELPIIREACLRVLVLCTIFLKEAARYGLCLSEIGEMMSRESSRPEEVPSELEVVCMEAIKLVGERDACQLEDEPAAEDIFQLDIDQEENSKPPSYHSDSGGQNLEILISGLGEMVEEEDDDNLEKEDDDNLEGDDEDLGEENDEDTEQQVTSSHKQLSDVSNLSVSLKDVSLTEEIKHYRVGRSYTGGYNQHGNRNNTEGQFTPSANFVCLSNMEEDGWVAFLEKFQELLHNAFHGRRFRASYQRQEQSISYKF